MRSLNAPHCPEEAAMPRIGVRELKTRASEVTRDVHDNHVRYTITNRGEPLAILIPYSPGEESEPATAEAAWQEYIELRDMIGRGQQPPFDVADLMRELRR
jgi:prevent-host-death family protein